MFDDGKFQTIMSYIVGGQSYNDESYSPYPVTSGHVNESRHVWFSLYDPWHYVYKLIAFI